MPVKHEFQPAEVAELRKAFDIFDEDGSGTIDHEELLKILGLLGRQTSPAEVAQMIQSVDTHGTGSISFDAFLLLLWKKRVEQKALEVYRHAFRTFNQSGTGYMTATEMKFLLLQLGKPLADDDVDEMMFEADEDQDRRLSFDEFVGIMQRVKRQTDDMSPVTRRGWEAEHSSSHANWLMVAEHIATIADKSGTSMKCMRPVRQFTVKPFKDPRTHDDTFGRAISSILSHCRAGDTILLSPGKYTDPFTVAMEGITIAANLDMANKTEGMSDEDWIKQRRAGVVIDVDNKNPAVVIRAKQFCLENVTVSNKQGLAIAIEMGYCELKNCDVTGLTGGISVRNRAFPIIEKCTVRDSHKAFGIQVKEARAIIEHCTLSGNYDGGVLVERSSNPWVSECRFVRGVGSGAVFTEGSSGVICRCEFTQNSCQGALILQNSNPILWANTFVKGKASGIKVEEGGRGHIAENIFQDNFDHDVEVGKGSNPVISENDFKGGNSTAIFLQDNSMVTVEKNKFANYQMTAVKIGRMCHVTIEENSVYGVCDGEDEFCRNGITAEADCQGKVADNKLVGWKPGYHDGRVALSMEKNPHLQSKGNVVQFSEQEAQTESIVNMLGTGGLARKQTMV